MTNDLNRRFLLGGLTGAAGIAALASIGKAGPLNPPAGPVTSTPGPEPRIAVNAANTPGNATSVYRITQPGSYYLTGNVQGVAGKHGIVIASAGVTLDLCGFSLIGTFVVGGTGSAGGPHGISTSPTSLNCISVRNGTVRNWTGSGVTFSTGTNAQVEQIIAEDCGDNGIAAGYNSLITRCTVSGCGSVGIAAIGGSTITHCTARSNQIGGINVGSAGNGVIAQCAAYSNHGYGIRCYGGLVSRCSAYNNDGVGISASFGDAIIESCTSNNNELDGINVESDCRVVNCLCVANGTSDTIGAGIRVTGARNTLDGNTSTANDFGYYVEDPGNLIVRNTAAANTTNWVIAADNHRGPIIDRTAATSAAIVGNGAASTLATTDPHANFTM